MQLVACLGFQREVLKPLSSMLHYFVLKAILIGREEKGYNAWYYLGVLCKWILSNDKASFVFPLSRLEYELKWRDVN